MTIQLPLTNQEPCLSGPKRLPRRYDGIQALRLLAALLVVITHSTFYAHERFSESIPVWRPGAVGVDIFFIISGFVMMASSMSLVGKTQGWKVFAARRLLRIVPMYWIATSLKVALMLAIPSLVLHAEFSPWRVVSSYLFIPSFNAEGRVEPLVGVGWTLLFEMFFYAIFCIALALRRNSTWLVGLLLVLCSAIGLFRKPEWPAISVYFDPVTIYFAVGMVFYWVSRRMSAVHLLSSAAILAVAAWSAIYFLNLTVIGAANSMGAVLGACTLTLLVVALEPWIGGKIPKPILFMGEASYALYLFHPFVSPVIPELARRANATWLPAPALVLLSVLAAVGASALIYRLLERPLTDYLKMKTAPVIRIWESGAK